MEGVVGAGMSVEVGISVAVGVSVDAGMSVEVGSSIALGVSVAVGISVVGAAVGISPSLSYLYSEYEPYPPGVCVKGTGRIEGTTRNHFGAARG